MELRSVPMPASLSGETFYEVAEWLFRTSSVTMIGLEEDNQLMLNPGRQIIKGTEVCPCVVLERERRRLRAVILTAGLKIRLKM